MKVTEVVYSVFNKLSYEVHVTFVLVILYHSTVQSSVACCINRLYFVENLRVCLLLSSRSPHSVSQLILYIFTEAESLHGCRCWCWLCRTTLPVWRRASPIRKWWRSMGSPLGRCSLCVYRKILRKGEWDLSAWYYLKVVLVLLLLSIRFHRCVMNMMRSPVSLPI